MNSSDVGRPPEPILTAEHLEVLRAFPTSAKRTNRVQLAMELLGISKATLAERTGLTWQGVHDTVICRYPDVRMATARRFARALGCGVDDLFPDRLEAKAS